MQQMNPEGTKGAWQATSGNHTGSSQYDEGYTGSSNQKLNADDDEQFADILARKIKQQLKSELRTGKDETLGYRVALAIVSVCMIVPLFIGLVVALALGLTGGATIALGWGFAGACAVIFAVNAFFHTTTTEVRKREIELIKSEREQVQGRAEKRE